MRSTHEIMKEREEARKIVALREITGRGVFQCKKALRLNGWDIEKARKWLYQFSDSYIFKERREIRK